MSSSAAATAAEVVGRDPELAAISGFLAQLPPGTLALEGEAGVGKTTLWWAAVEEARDRGLEVLSTRPVGAEAQLSLSGLADLLRQLPADAAAGLPEPQQRALRVVLAEEEGAAGDLEGRVLATAFLNLLSTTSEHRPLLLAIDDLQWLDRSSGGVLVFALRRLRGAPVGLLVSCRCRPGGSLPLELERVVGDGVLLRLPIGPLSEGALHHLLHQRLGLSLPRALLHAVHETSGGNPFFALELGRAGIEPAGDGTIRLPRSLEDLVATRLRRLPRRTRDALLYVAALSEPATGVLERLDMVEALEPAIAADVLEQREGLVRFSHPLLASATWNAAAAGRRREVDRALAAALDDPEQRARHLALAADAPDADVAAALESAAAHAEGRGATTAACELLERARVLTPVEDLERWARLTRESARVEYLAGDWERPLELAREALAHLPPGPERAEILALACEMRYGQLDLALQAVAESGEGRARVLALMALEGQLQSAGRLEEQVVAAAESCAVAERLGERDLLGVTLTVLGAAKLLNDIPGAREHITRALEIKQALGRLPTQLFGQPETWLAIARLRLDDDPVAQQPLVEQQLRRMRECGDERGYCLLALELVDSRVRTGEWASARALAEECAELSELAGYAEGRGDYAHALATIAACEGNLERARELDDFSFALRRELGDALFSLDSHVTLLFVDLCEGNVESALARDAELRAFFSSENPFFLRGSFYADEIEALVLAGDREQARFRIERLREEGGARGWPRFLAWADRGEGLVRAAEGDLAGAQAALESALSRHDEFAFPLERGRTMLAHGQVLRRSMQRRAAREALSGALWQFERLGAEHFTRKAREELARIGGRHPGLEGELSATEQKVASLVAEGLSNKEVAAQLFVTVRAVEATLTRVYAKLGVRSRLQLARNLDESRRTEAE